MWKVTIWTQLAVIGHIAGSLLWSHDYRMTNEIHEVPVLELLIDSCITTVKKQRWQSDV